MRTYEILFILKPDLAEEVFAETKERLQKIIADFGGEFINEADGWGKKRLAYSIEDYMEGIYSLWNFKGQPETVAELDRVIKLSDKFLRHMIIRQDEK
ncbi:MAG: 30S ribosomal protein S6 [Syntrophomonadaceae bacterium]|nr:30S ribosomal protein S6 [Syntrophomonadaceae bacterium]MDD3888670.1 30S ribosomal protein S6 [Syntrophomonadaceae bacterium]MDD4548514.1 30S ribosomal protein S6 [Syntrophomonadaceae bacterium]